MNNKHTSFVLIIIDLKLSVVESTLIVSFYSFCPLSSPRNVDFMSQIRVFVTCCQLWHVFILVNLTSNERQNSCKSVDLLVATIDDVSVVKLAQ